MVTATLRTPTHWDYHNMACKILAPLWGNLSSGPATREQVPNLLAAYALWTFAIDVAGNQERWCRALADSAEARLATADFDVES